MQITIRTVGNKKSPFSSEGVLFILAMLLMVSFQITGCQNPNAAAPHPPAEVEVAAVSQKDAPIYSEWVATLDGYVNAQISPQVSGYIIAQDYKEGSYVQKGQTLFRIDPRLFQAILDQAKAQLAQAEAQSGKTQLDLDRDIAVESGVKWRLT